MTYPAPSPPPPPHPHVAAAPAARRGGWRPVLLVSLLIGAVIAALAGTGAFLGSRNLNGGDAAVRCGDGNLCFATLEVEQVTGFLSARGFTCERARECALTGGNATYEATWRAAQDRNRMRRYEARVWTAAELGIPPRGEEFLAWFAALPFAHDQAKADEARQWLATRLQSDVGNRVATIGGYEYTLIRGSGGEGEIRVTLRVEAGETWL